MNLLIVESPLQLLCAYEAIKSNPETPYRLLLRNNGRGSNDIHLYNCAYSLQLNYQTFLLRPDYFKYDLLKSLPLLLSICRKEYNQVYLGSYYSSFLRALKRGLRREETYYLDDGAATLRAQLEQMKEVNSKINWFTFFNILPLQGQKIKRHSFESLRKTCIKERKFGSYFIGQPVEIMSGYTKNQYYNSVSTIAHRFTEESPLLYIPHRIEDIELIKNISNIKVIKPDFPLELYFLQPEIHEPLEVFGFYSTALITLKKIFPNMKSYYIQNPNSVAPAIVQVLGHYKKNDIIEIVSN